MTEGEDEVARRRPRWLLAAVAILAVLAILGGAAMLLHHPGTTSPAANREPAAASPGVTPSASPTADPLHPGVPPSTTGLAPEMKRRLRLALAAAKQAGVSLRVNEGFRTRARQQQLHQAAVKKYGSEKEASKWVLPAALSEHPRGRAADVGPPSGARWLDRHGYEFGLCRRYTNETWHFEPMTYPGSPCPKRQPYAGG